MRLLFAIVGARRSDYNGRRTIMRTPKRQYDIIPSGLTKQLKWGDRGTKKNTIWSVFPPLSAAVRALPRDFKTRCGHHQNTSDITALRRKNHTQQRSACTRTNTRPKRTIPQGKGSTTSQHFEVQQWMEGTASRMRSPAPGRATRHHRIIATVLLPPYYRHRIIATL